MKDKFHILERLVQRGFVGNACVDKIEITL